MKAHTASLIVVHTTGLLMLFFRDALIVPVANCLTSVFVGFVFFALMGYTADIVGEPIEKLIRSGEHLSASFLFFSAVSHQP